MKIKFLYGALLGLFLAACNSDDNGGNANDDYFAVVNRGSGTITYHNEDDLSLVGTTTLDASSQPTYVVYSKAKDRIYSGGLNSGLLYEINPSTFEVVRNINIGTGAFHMWLNDTTNQLWINNIGTTKKTTVVDLNSFEVIQTLDLPSLEGVTLTSSAVQHDVVISPDGKYAYVTIIDGSVSYVVQYNTSDYSIKGFDSLGGDGHLGFLGSRLFVMSANAGQVREYNYETLEVIRERSFSGAHGITSDGSNLFIGDFSGNRITKYDGANNSLVGTISTSSAATHNLAINDDADRLLLTYSGGAQTKVELYSVEGNAIASIATGDSGTNPFGVWYVDR